MKTLKALLLLNSMALCPALIYSQAPTVTIDPQRHGNLAAASTLR